MDVNCKATVKEIKLDKQCENATDIITPIRVVFDINLIKTDAVFEGYITQNKTTMDKKYVGLDIVSSGLSKILDKNIPSVGDEFKIVIKKTDPYLEIGFCEK